MKKTILTILLCGVMVLGMTGCGKQKNEFDMEISLILKFHKMML